MVWGQGMFHNSDGPTNQPTDQQTDRPSYRDAWTHLKKIILGLKNVYVICFIRTSKFFWKLQTPHFRFLAKNQTARERRQLERGDQRLRTPLNTPNLQDQVPNPSSHDVSGPKRTVGLWSVRPAFFFKSRNSSKNAI